MRTHRRELKRTTGLVINFDSVSSPLGHCELSCVGSGALAKKAVVVLSHHGVDTVLRRDVTPFVDNFPFNVAGVPSLYFGRANCSAGRWQHHSRHDTLENVSVDAVVRLLTGVTPLIEQLTHGGSWTFSTELPADQQTLARRLGRDLFGFAPSLFRIGANKTGRIDL